MSIPAFDVSVVVPVFNMEERLDTTLRCLCRQTLPSMEIIVVDDHSRDRTVEIANKVLSSESPHPWKVLVNNVNSGASSSRNRGLEESAGEFIFFIDGDDLCEDTCLEKLLSAARSCEADLAFCGFMSFFEETGRGKTYPSPGNTNDPKIILGKYLKGKRYLNASNVIYRRDLLVRNGILFTPGCRFAEDREFIVRALSRSLLVGIVFEPLVKYVQHQGQTTSSVGSGLNKYAHAVGVYYRLRKNLLQIAPRQGDNVSIIDSFEIPNAIIKMITSAAREGDMDLFIKMTASETLRAKVKPAWKTLLKKPEIAFKSFEMLFFPRLLYNSYRKKELSR